MRHHLSAPALAGILLLAGCGSGIDRSTDAAAALDGAQGSVEPAAADDASPDDPVAVTAVDYGFEGLPGEVAAGTSFSLTNTSETEAHELVAIRLHDGEQRSLSELLQLPDEERAAVGVPVGVTVAMPGQEGVSPGGAWSLREPGRYVLVCMIPQGADPEQVRQATAGPGGDVDGGPPHAALGMVAELIVR